MPGAECSGEVIEVSADISSDLTVGDKVICFGNGGGFSTHMAVHRNSCIRIPAEFSNKVRLEDAAALLVSYGTAYLALTARANLSPGDIVLVTAAAGGVGLACCELAKNMVSADIAFITILDYPVTAILLCLLRARKL